MHHMCECKQLFSSDVVITLAVYILHTLYSVTPCSIINTERTAVQHSVCVSEIFLWRILKNEGYNAFLSYCDYFYLSL